MAREADIRCYGVVKFERAVGGILGALDEIKEKAAPEFSDAINAAIQKIRNDALANLDKPHWLLSTYFRTKIRTYENGRYLFGMAGIERQSRAKNIRDPGYYSYFHEYGHFMEIARARETSWNWQPENKRRFHNVRGKSYEATWQRLFFRRALNKNRKTFIDAVYNTYEQFATAALEKTRDELNNDFQWSGINEGESPAVDDILAGAFNP